MRRFLMRAGAMALIAVALMTWSVSRSDAAVPCQICNDGGYAVNYGGSSVYNTGYAGYYGSYGSYGYYNGYYNGGYVRPGIIRRVGGAAIGTVGGAISGFWQGLTDPYSLFANARCGRCPLSGGYCPSCGVVCRPVYTTSYGCTPCSAPCAPMPCEAPCAAPAPCAPMPCEAPCAAPAPCAPMPCEAPAVCGPAPCMPPAMPCVPQIPAVAPVPPPCFAPAPCFAMTTCSPCEAPAPCAPMPCVAPCNGVYGGQSNYSTQPAVAPQRSSIAPAPAPAASNATLPPAAPRANAVPKAPAANVTPALPAQDDSVLPPPTTDYQPSQPGSILPPPTLDESMGGLPSASTQLRDASFSVVVPENAIVYVNNYQTKATGSTRSFVSSDLQPGKVYPYAVRVLVPTNTDVRGKTVEVNGQNYTEVAKTVYVRAGEEVNLAFSATERDPLIQLASKK